MNAFEDLVNEYGTAIFNYIFSLVKHKELAEDLYQEVLLSAYLAYPSIKEQSKYKSWLFTIAINKCRDYWRKENKSKAILEGRGLFLLCHCLERISIHA
ncbi:RNA polymerase sigma factor [Neobacillus sp. 19]|uniref:RNA polymerase sigma factor n=1 Tax=Neobacillus sp. 19 TaxID=3394458 RepID=UPI003BF765CC